MGQLVYGVVGAVIGAYFGNPALGAHGDVRVGNLIGQASQHGSDDERAAESPIEEEDEIEHR